MNNSTPLAERIRPKDFSQYIGQEHLVGKNGAIRMMVEGGNLLSIILWGPPGTGKTTLAHIIARESKRDFYTLSAISSGIKEVREIIEKSKKETEGIFGKGKPIVFIDEIHRFNKAQQDSLLEAVEKGWITLIGATTENPSFEVISALLSRCQVYVLNHLEKQDLNKLLERALQDDIIRERKIIFKEKDALFRISGGDGRKLLNTFEIVVNTLWREEKIEIDNEKVLKIVQTSTALYDKTGEQHYDIISAFIKSIRGSDPNAAVYWLARMIEGGEDVKFIARRMIILASEDIGLANPTALILANNTFEAVNVIGYPEARIILSQCAIYLATSPKSNASYKAIGLAQQIVRQTGNLPVPIHLRNAPTKLMKELNYAKDYLYAHDYPNNFVFEDFLPEELQGHTFYEPGENQKEKNLRKHLKDLWKDRYKY